MMSLPGSLAGAEIFDNPEWDVEVEWPCPFRMKRWGTDGGRGRGGHTL